jgi:uncharacterized membrane protein YphA (DoxX/SURF4 family)
MEEPKTEMEMTGNEGTSENAAPPADEAGISPSLESRIMDGVALLLRLVLAGLFIYSAILHIRDPFTFMNKVNEYNILPSAWVQPFAYILPWSMAVCAGLLVIGLAVRPAAAGLGLMLVSFIIAIGVNIYRDRVLGCGCFSAEGHAIGWPLVIQDIFLLAATIFLVLRGAGRFSIDAFIKRILTQRHREHGESLK